MAMITCPECGKDVSDKANKCPHCGFKIRVDQISKKIRGIQNHKVTKKQGCIGCLFFFILMILLVIILHQCDVNNQQEKNVTIANAQAAEKQKQEELAAKENAKTPVQKRMEHLETCFSQWDGEHLRIARWLKSNGLNDPGSYQHIKTRFSHKESGDTVLVVTDFTAKNAFSGRVRNMMTFRTLVPKNKDITPEDSNWCPVIDPIIN